MFPAGRRFIGRQATLDRVGETFARGARLVCLWGPGGIGKTRVAAQFATAAPHGYSPWFCDLSEVRDRTGIAAALAQALDVPLAGGGTRDALQQVGRAIAHRGRCLVVLDNFEQLVDHGAATVGKWIEQAPQARFLVTSRESLGIAGEVTLELPPLPLATEAVELFVERVRGSNPEFRVSGEMGGKVADIVERLEGLPLAIELAAARVAVLGLDGLQARLGKRLDVLTKGVAGAPPRQATLRGALEWSWDLLSAKERDALAATSVFRGGFSLDSAEAVIGADAVERLESLREKALLLSAQDPEFPERMRFALSDSVRELASEKLAAGARVAMEKRHRDHFLAQATRLRETARGRGAESAFRELGSEQPNFLAVVERCLAARPPDWACALDVVLALDPLLSARGPAQLRLDLFDSVLAAAKTAGAQAAAPLASAHVARGVANRVRGHAEAADRDFETARTTARKVRAPEIEAEALIEHGILVHERRQLDAARNAYEEALGLTLDARTQARALGNLGAVCHDAQSFDEARERYHIALEICVKTGETRLEGLYRLNLAILEQERGDRLESAEQYRRALDRLAAARDRRLLAITRGSLGTLLQENGDWVGALALHDEALRALREVGDLRSEGLALGRAGVALSMLGRVSEASDALDEAERIVVVLGDDIATASVRLNRAFLDLAAEQKAAVRGDADARSKHRAAVLTRMHTARAPGKDGVVASSVSDDVRIALRILESALADAAPSKRAKLRVGANATWFEAPKHERSDLSKHAAARRILLRLLEEHRVAPRRALSLEDLREAGWPGERLSADAATNRTHVALALLRKMGLKAHLSRTDEGYLLDPDLPVEWLAN